MDNKISVVICGEIFSLRSGENPDHVQRLARYVDGKLTDIMSKSISAAIDDKARTFILALNIADDYMKSNDKLARLDAVHKKFVAEMGRLQDENAKLNQSLKETRAELEKERASNLQIKLNKPQKTASAATEPPTQKKAEKEPELLSQKDAVQTSEQK